VKVAAVVAALALALVLQTTFAELLVRGTAALDLVLVVVVYVALSSGPATGLLAGAAAGLAQDALSSGIIGIGGLAKTVVGFLAGLMGTQFIVVRALPRFVVFFAATVLHAVLFMGAYELLDLRTFGVPYGAVLSQAAANALVGALAFHLVDLMPGYMERRAAMRGRTRVRRRLD
jgi:rod shape-determining protein MreD